METQSGMRPVGHRDGHDEEAERDEARRRKKDFSKARQRIDLLHEERQLQQARSSLGGQIKRSMQQFIECAMAHTIVTTATTGNRWQHLFLWLPHRCRLKKPSRGISSID